MPPNHLLGAHVSSAGGTPNAPERAAALDTAALQLFTKQPNRWAEPEIDEETADAFRMRRAAHDIQIAGAHDSYLINLASPDAALRARSLASYRAELARCERLGLDFLVSHPGNATDGDRASGIDRNADAITEALEAVPGTTRLLLEGTAGTGHALGSTFEELGALIERIAPTVRTRVGVCLDTCHLYAAGYDIRDDYDGVIERFDDLVGLDRLGAFHLNDSKTPFDSRRDRHTHIGEGSLGLAPFRRLVGDPRLDHLPMLLETPKDDDARIADRRNLAVLRALRAES